VSVGSLLARFHRAAQTYRIPRDATWRGGFTPGVEHTIVCHNDPVVGNVVFRGEEAVALIDFDFAGPNDPVWDLAIAAQHWVPLGDPADVLASAGWSPSDRLDGICEAYGLPDKLRSHLIDLIEDYLERGRLGVQARVRGGDPRFVAYWEAGLGNRLLRALRWLRDEGGFLRGKVT
jgi:thiamine kinase-like enzyme